MTRFVFLGPFGRRHGLRAVTSIWRGGSTENGGHASSLLLYEYAASVGGLNKIQIILPNVRCASVCDVP